MRPLLLLASTAAAPFGRREPDSRTLRCRTTTRCSGHVSATISSSRSRTSTTSAAPTSMSACSGTLRRRRRAQRADRPIRFSPRPNVGAWMRWRSAGGLSSSTSIRTRSGLNARRRGTVHLWQLRWREHQNELHRWYGIDAIDLPYSDYEKSEFFAWGRANAPSASSAWDYDEEQDLFDHRIELAAMPNQPRSAIGMADTPMASLSLGAVVGGISGAAIRYDQRSGDRPTL